MIGIGCLFLAVLLTLIAGVLNLMNIRNMRKRSLAKKEMFTDYFYVLSVVAVAASAIFLWYIFFSNQFVYNYVANYSSADLSPVFKITAFWAGAQGSMLLWVLLHGLVGVFLNLNKKVSQAAKLVFSFIQLALLIMVLVRSPFVMGSAVEGGGLTPDLQNFWMISHPPLLFLGYAGLAVPFAMAVGSLIEGKYKSWLKRALPFSLLAFAFLGLGIFFGGYWAYEALGWGGYWAWDPVENSSLIPWLTCGALVHFLILSIRKKVSLKMTYLMAIVSFSLAVYGTYLTRSGVLSKSSVHSFGGDESMLALLLGIFVAVLLVIPIFILLARWMNMPSAPEEPVMTRWFTTYSGASLLSVFAVFVLAGVAMLHVMGLFGQATGVSKSFYNISGLLLIVPILALLVMATLLTWKKTSKDAVKAVAGRTSSKISSGKISGKASSHKASAKKASGKKTSAKASSGKKSAQKGSSSKTSSRKTSSGKAADKSEGAGFELGRVLLISGISLTVVVAIALILVFLLYGGFSSSALSLEGRPMILTVVFLAFLVLGIAASCAAFVMSGIPLLTPLLKKLQGVRFEKKMGKGMSKPALVTHMGLAVLVVGILFSAGASSGFTGVTLTEGEEVELLGEKVTYIGRDVSDQGYISKIQMGNKTAEVVTNFDPKFGTKVIPEILRSLTKDHYLVTYPIKSQAFEEGQGELRVIGGETLKVAQKDHRQEQSADNALQLDEIYTYEVTLVTLNDEKAEQEDIVEIEVIAHLTLEHDEEGEPHVVAIRSDSHLLFNSYMIHLDYSDTSGVMIPVVTPMGDPAYAKVDVSKEPLINLVWLGTIMISAGIMWAAVKRLGS